MSFAQKVLSAAGNDIRLVTAREENEPCWFFLQMDPVLFNEYKEAVGTGEIENLSKFGTILECDWGEFPPNDVIALMQRKYHFKPTQH